MNKLDLLLNRLSSQPQPVQVAVLVGLAIVGADTLTLIFYSIFFYDRLMLDLALTTLIVIIVGVPIASLFVRQHGRIVVMAEELRRLSDLDDLTDLLNRRAFYREASRHRRDGPESSTLLFIDCDHFKKINDTSGHEAGDRVLRSVAHVIKAVVGTDGVASRIGGEEFAVLLSPSSPEAGVAVAETIRRSVMEQTFFAGSERVTVSIGVAHQDGGATFESMLRIADERLYVAKQRGRNVVVATNVAEAA
jgi:diguanylate cyclase (GGDEF)-like protein